MKIRTKIFLSLFIIGTVLTIAGALVFYFHASNEMRKQVNSRLNVVAKSEAKHIDFSIEQYLQTIRLFASRDEIRSTLRHFNINKDEASRLKLKNIVKSAGSILVENPDLCILDSSGIVVVSTIEGKEGQDLSGNDFFYQGKDKENFYLFYDESNTPHIRATAPLFFEDKFLGLAKLETGIEKIGEIALALPNIGETGQIYLVNTDKNILFASGKDVPYQANTKLDTDNMNECVGDYAKYRTNGFVLPHEEEIVESRINDKIFLGAHYYVTKEKWCLLLEIERAEALAPLNFLFFFTTILIIVLLIVIFISANIIGATLGRPITRLQRGAEIIAKGDLNYRVGTNRGDEIGQLSRAFDKMTIAIKRSRADVDKKVEQQTKEIRERRQELEGQQKAVLNVLEDVQEEKEKATREKERLNTILYSIGDAVFVVDENFRITVFNKAASILSGYSAKEALGKPYTNIFKIINEKTREPNDSFVKDTLTTGRVQEMSGNNILVAKDGKETAISDSSAPLKDGQGNIVGCVVVFRDTTLEREVDRAKTDFVSLASHQLRTPLSTIKWYLEMLEESTRGKCSEEQKEYLKNINASNERMIELINALLNVSRIEMGTFGIRPKSIDIKKVADMAIKDLALQIKEKQINFKKVFRLTAPSIKADPKLLEIVFQNLLSNSIKYTPSGGRITFEISDAGRDVLIKISDSGCGIPRRQQSKIFTKLFRADNVREIDNTGTGLGLYIVKEVVNQSGGKIWFESELNKGTTFFVTLPVSGVRPVKGGRGLELIK